MLNSDLPFSQIVIENDEIDNLKKEEKLSWPNQNTLMY